MQQPIAWRSMHSQGRGLFSVLLKHLPDIDTRTVREAEFVCNSLIGFNFGDGHLHNEDLINAVQDEARVRARRAVVVWVESQAIHSKVQHYKVIDAALGVIERGTWKVADAVERTALAAQRPDPIGCDVDPHGRAAEHDQRSRSDRWHEYRGGRRQRAQRARRRRRPRQGKGVQVTVLEAADEIGGGTRTSEAIVPGLLHDHCSAFHPMAVGSPFLNSLGLDRYGLRMALA